MYLYHKQASCITNSEVQQNSSKTCECNISKRRRNSTKNTHYCDPVQVTHEKRAADSLDDLCTGRSNTDGNRMEVGHLQSSDGIAAHTQDAVLALGGGDGWAMT